MGTQKNGIRRSLKISFSMKKGIILVALGLSFLVSCKVQSPTLAPFVSVYKRDWSGEVLPVYIILRHHPVDVFEYYIPAMGESVLGQWHTNGDTLFVQYDYDFYCSKEKTKVQEITDQDTLTTAALPRKLLMKKDRLIDATDYSQVIPGYHDSNPDVFERVK